MIEIAIPIHEATGWGLIGLHLALEWEAAGHAVRIVQRPERVPALYRSRIDGLCACPEVDGATVVWPLGNDCSAAPKAELPDRRHVGLLVFEDTGVFDAEAIERLKTWDQLVTFSSWAQQVLASHGIVAALWHQGYDPSLWHPAERASRTKGQFRIFSGGKLEFRKGQDIVVEAFRRFHATHPEAVLVTAWHNPWPQTMAGVWSSGYVRGIPSVREGRQDVTGWLAANGVTAVEDVGAQRQPDLAQIVRSCDVAIFPNRCEGATNIALVEAMGAGVPVIASGWTGHADVAGGSLGGRWLTDPKPVTAACELYAGMDGWGEADPADIVAALEQVAPGTDEPLLSSKWTWREAAAALHGLVA